MNDRIERLYLVDLDIAVRAGDDLFATCDELIIGLLVTRQVLIADPTTPVVRFSGPRNQLEELINRYNGVAQAFAPHRSNPDVDFATGKDRSPVEHGDPDFEG